jgi:hypothetical protein
MANQHSIVRLVHYGFETKGNVSVVQEAVPAFFLGL